MNESKSISNTADAENRLLCEKTGNLCGTDTIALDHPCSCRPCRAWTTAELIEVTVKLAETAQKLLETERAVEGLVMMGLIDKTIVDRMLRVPSARGWLFSDMDAAYLNDTLIKQRLESLPDISALRGKST